MKKLKHIFILVLSCLAFTFIDDAYAYEIRYSSGSCTTNYSSYWNNVYYLDLNCQDNTTFYIYFDKPIEWLPDSAISNPRPATLIESVTTITGSINASNSNFSGTVAPSLIRGYAHKSICSLEPNGTWCQWYPNANVNSNSMTLYNVLNSYRVYYSSSFDVSGHVQLGYTVSSVERDDENNILTSFQSTISNKTNDKLDSVNDSINDTNDYIKDDTPPDVDMSVLGNVQGLFPPGPVDSLLNIPAQFLSVLTSSFGGVCVPLTGKFVFDSTLTLPCFSDVFYDNVPALLMNFINLIPSAFILIKYFKHLYKKVDRAVNFNANADDEWGVL